MNSNRDEASKKLVKVRTPRRGRSKSICVPNLQQQNNKNFPIGRLNNYNPSLKRYNGSLSMISELECINEGEQSNSLNFDEKRSDFQSVLQQVSIQSDHRSLEQKPPAESVSSASITL